MSIIVQVEYMLRAHTLAQDHPKILLSLPIDEVIDNYEVTESRGYCLPTTFIAEPSPIEKCHQSAESP